MIDNSFAIAAPSHREGVGRYAFILLQMKKQCSYNTILMNSLFQHAPMVGNKWSVMASNVVQNFPIILLKVQHHLRLVVAYVWTQLVVARLSSFKLRATATCSPTCMLITRVKLAIPTNGLTSLSRSSLVHVRMAIVLHRFQPSSTKYVVAHMPILRKHSLQTTTSSANHKVRIN